MIARAPTTFAVGFLLLDALLLAYSGFALGRRWLVFWARCVWWRQCSSCSAGGDTVAR